MELANLFNIKEKINLGNQRENGNEKENDRNTEKRGVSNIVIKNIPGTSKNNPIVFDEDDSEMDKDNILNNNNDINILNKMEELCNALNKSFDIKTSIKKVLKKDLEFFEKRENGLYNSGCLNSITDKANVNRFVEHNGNSNIIIEAKNDNVISDNIGMQDNNM